MPTGFRALATLTLAVLFGCAAPLAVAPRDILDTDAAGIAGCAKLGVVRGTSDMGDLAHGQGLDQARGRARREAARLGADHLVWRPVPPVYVPFVAADAYRCKTDKAPAP